MINQAISKQFIAITLLLCIGKTNITSAAEIIASPRSPTSFISLNDIRQIFFMRIHEWPDGTPINVYVLEDHNEVHKAFSKEKLGVFPYKLRRLWDRHIFSGTGQAPVVVNTESEMIKIISSSQGSIGYANKSTIDEAKQGGFNVQIINIK